jgi:hypothetical protein
MAAKHFNLFKSFKPDFWLVETIILPSSVDILVSFLPQQIIYILSLRSIYDRISLSAKILDSEEKGNDLEPFFCRVSRSAPPIEM